MLNLKERISKKYTPNNHLQKVKETEMVCKNAMENAGSKISIKKFVFKRKLIPKFLKTSEICLKLFPASGMLSKVPVTFCFKKDFSSEFFTPSTFS